MAHRKLYDEIGVNPDADTSQIKKAYRKKAKRVHPDHGGNEDEFNKLNRAFLVLSNPETRSKYDKTGDETLQEPDNFQQKIMIIISSALEQILTNMANRGRDPCENDIVSEMRQKIKEEIQKGETHIANCNTLMNKTKKLQGRFKVNKGNNFLEQMIAAKITNIELTINNSQREIEPLKEAYDLLKDASFTFDSAKQQHAQYASSLMQALGMSGI